MNNFYACMNVFNEANTIRKVIDSAASVFDGFIVVDGAYKDFPMQGDEGKSDDGTLEILRTMQSNGYNIHIITPERGPWESEIQKRNHYLDPLKPGDWFMRLDGDELVYQWIHTRHDMQTQEFDSYNVLLAYENQNQIRFTDLTAIYKYRPGMRYEGSHSRLVNDQTGAQYNTGKTHIVLKELRQRPPERSKAREAFYQTDAYRSSDGY